MKKMFAAVLAAAAISSAHADLVSKNDGAKVTELPPEFRLATGGKFCKFKLCRKP